MERQRLRLQSTPLNQLISLQNIHGLNSYANKVEAEAACHKVTLNTKITNTHTYI